MYLEKEFASVELDVACEIAAISFRVLVLAVAALSFIAMFIQKLKGKIL